jgi:hypothetical protein
MYRLLWQKKALIAFLGLIVCLLPGALSKPAQMMTKVVLTEITIDMAVGEYSLSGLMMVGEETEVVEATAPSVAEAINKIATEQGRQVSFAHCTQIVLGEGLADENVYDVLKYFYYRAELNNNCNLSWKAAGVGATMEQFFKDHSRYTAVGMMSQGHGERAIFKSGVYGLSLDEGQTDSLNFALGNKAKKRLVYANEVLHVSRNRARIKARFVDGVPRADIEIKMTTQLESNPHVTREATELLARGLEKQIKQGVEDVVATLYTAHADVLGIYDRFHRYNTRDFKRYFESNNLDDFYKELTVYILVDICVKS